MSRFFKVGLLTEITDDDIENSFLEYSEDDKLFTFKLNERGKEILRDVSKNQHMDMSEFVRKSLIDTIQRIYE